MSTNIIAINRGDSYDFELTINDENNPDANYRLCENDAIYFGLMDPNQEFEDALVKKKYTESDYVDGVGGTYDALTITINPEDTLDLLPGRYFYMVKLKMDHYNEYGEHVEKVKTIINKTKFRIYD